MERPLYQVDAFSDRPFAGNPAAVVLLERDDAADADWMQRVATEMNLAETAFVRPRADGAYALRWFTPRVEVALCGHATLASAHVLWETGRLAPAAEARFHTLHRGVLRCRREASGWMAMDFPADPPERADPPAALAALLPAGVRATARATYDWLVELPGASAVRDCQPDLRALAAIDMRGLIVTAPGDGEGVDYVNRFFAPRYGVDEDPVTGSAQCVLGPWWAARLNRDRLVGRQISSRGGTLRVAVRGERIDLAGQAVTVFHARLQP